MRTFTITRNQLVLAIVAWFGIFTALSLNSITIGQGLNIIGFLFLLVVPGLLTVFILEFKDLNFWGYVGVSVGLSLIEVMLVVLLGNTFLPFAGIARPLDKPVLLAELYLLTGILLATAWIRIKSIDLPLKRYAIFDNGRDMAFALVPALFVVASVLGAIRLNNGGSGIITLCMLVAMGIYSIFVVYKSKELGLDVIPISFFFMSLSLLFMTSLRGWFVTGHDIQREFFVFQLAKNNGIWSIASLKDAYNACMSITILPTIFSNLLSLPDPYVFKVLFQTMFATLPGVLYLMVRRYVSAGIAFLATFYFIAFPTFYTDLIFMNRQEVAFLFLGLMLYVIFNTDLSLAMRRGLFIIFGIGMVLSHYSTTYTVVAVLVFLILARPVSNWFMAQSKKRKWFARSGIGELRGKNAESKASITVLMVVVLVGATFLWSSVLTNTASGSLYRVIGETLSVMKSNTKEDAKSSDVSYNLLSWQTASPNQLLAAYQENVVAPLLLQAPTSTYYDPSTYDQYPITATAGDSLPITWLGKIIGQLGVNVASLAYLLKQASAKVLQVLIVVGFIAILFAKRLFKKPLPAEYVVLAIGSLIFIAAQVILPVLSVEYGVLRAFQQSLMFLGLFIVIGSVVIAGRSGEKIGIWIALVIALGFFLSSSGVFTQWFGGSDPQLSLNNTGLYYDIYYLRSEDIAGVSWLANVIDHSGMPPYKTDVQSDPSLSTRITYMSDLVASGNIYPALIREDSYVVLGATAIQEGETTMSYNGTYITYQYPIQFLDTNKDLIYNNGSFRVYK